MKVMVPRVLGVLLEFCASHFTQCSRSTNKYECVAQESPGTSRLPDNSPFILCRGPVDMFTSSAERSFLKRCFLRATACAFSAHLSYLLRTALCFFPHL